MHVTKKQFLLSTHITSNAPRLEQEEFFSKISDWVIETCERNNLSYPLFSLKSVIFSTSCALTWDIDSSVDDDILLPYICINCIKGIDFTIRLKNSDIDTVSEFHAHKNEDEEKLSMLEPVLVEYYNKLYEVYKTVRKDYEKE